MTTSALSARQTESVVQTAMPTVEHLVPTVIDIESVEFTPGKVHAAIMKLKVGGASGPDGFEPLLFQKAADCIVGPLSLIFSPFISVGKIPSEWSHALVTLVNKGGSATNVSNYRPISLPCVASKIMERVIAHNMLICLRGHNVISKQQHGFLSGRSATSNLLETLNDWTLTINNGKSVCITNVDFAKAFDSVCTSKLLCKLQSYG